MHNLNADKNLNWPLKFAYILLNVVNNSFPNWLVDRNLELVNYSTKTSLDGLGDRSTLSRRFSNLFWRDLNWKELKKDLRKINVFDIGCGAGDITERLYTEYARGKINSYKGVDVFPHPKRWHKLSSKHKGLSFSKITDERKILNEIPKKTNLIISQSSLEHIEDDLLVFEQVGTFIEKSKHKVVQIHLVPSAACLWLYLFHGVRQYSPRTISKITRFFKDSSCQLISLGGNESFKLQWQVFAKQEIFKRFDIYKLGLVSDKWQGSNFNKTADDPKVISEYEKLAKQVMRKDMNYPGKKPVFYALVIKSDSNEK